MKSAAIIDVMIPCVETLLGIRFTCVRKNRYNALCPFHADTRDRFIWEYPAHQGVGKEIIDKFNIGFAPPYSDEQHHGRALMDGFSPLGLVGRSPGDRGVRWLKHQTREIPLSARSGLYGLDKARRCIRQYRTIILVEGISDYFTFYNLLHDQGKAVVVSTLGSYISPEAATILKGLAIEHYIVAYDWDELGRNGIERMAAKSGGWVYFLGGLADDQAPDDLLEPVTKSISGFSLKHRL